VSAVRPSGQLLVEPPVVVREGEVTPPGVTASAALARFPPRPVALHWPATAAARCDVVERVTSALSVLGESVRVGSNRRRGLGLLLDWLEDQPGQSWQQRWLASGADADGDDWAQAPRQWLVGNGKWSSSRLELMTSSLLAVVGADVVRPSLTWLLTGGKKRKLTRNMIRSRDRDGFEHLQRLCEHDAAITAQAQSHTEFRCAVIVAAKGGTLADINVGDVLEVLDAEARLRGQRRSGSATFRLLREMGIFGPDVPSLREVLSVGPRTVDELVDRYPIACRSIRDLLVAYLKERQPSVDHGTIRNHAYVLARCFWLDLERHHHGIESLALPSDVASAWKQRLRTRTTPTSASPGGTVERLSYLDVLAAVRAFYLDLAEWALEDPGRWCTWVAPCPIRQDELTRRKAVRHRKARMDARTRDRLPVLPILVRAAHQWRHDSEAVLPLLDARPSEKSSPPPAGSSSARSAPTPRRTTCGRGTLRPASTIC
jgi:hypothetical protein